METCRSAAFPFTDAATMLAVSALFLQGVIERVQL
jgi:hypothetical protein